MPKPVNRKRRQLKMKKAREAKLALRRKRRHQRMRREKEDGFVIDLSFGPIPGTRYSRTTVALAVLFIIFTLLPFDNISSQSITASVPAGALSAAEAVNVNTYPVADEAAVIFSEDWQKEIREILAATPMAAMTNEVVKRDRAVAAFLVGIAMKESKFGKYAPKKDGTECYNFWGYRGRENTTASGYSCFAGPEQAIKIVGDRIEAIVKQGAKTPADMISWKCGRTCAGHSPESVEKWISDVASYYYRLNPAKEIAKNK